jgi:high-affinity iron transporter
MNAMIGALIIVLREVIEAGLIVGIVLAVTKNIPGRMIYIVAGLIGGLAGAALVAVFAREISDALEGYGQEVFNASILALAVVMLTWHNVWMARHGREMSDQLHQIGDDIRAGTRSLGALAVIVGIAVLREGAEVVLFLYGIVVSSGTTGFELLTGGLLGLVAGVGISSITYLGLAKIPLRHLFRVTTLLIAFIAAGMASQSVGFLQQAGIITKFDRVMWDTTSVLPANSMLGRVFQTLLGYSDQPTQLQLVAYLATLLVIFGLMKLMAPPPRPVQGLATHKA